MFRTCRILPVLGLAALAGPAGAAVDFNRDIRPILTTHCTACHGGVKAAAGVSFVYREKAVARAKSGEIVIIPGQPDASEMIRRITSTDPDEVMPQPDHGPPLKPDQIAVIRQWIAEGAPWSEHWSLVPPTDPPVPAVQDPQWVRQPMDAFVKARLEAENLRPSPEASPEEWLRRVYLDLAGLPPSLEDFQQFQAALERDSAAAREAVVDRLLASPAFGERWASDWLDLARYADTYGYEKDPHRDIWPWRDWVISALNADLPFDQFTIKQLAGDLLPEPSAADLLATAFHRNTQNNTEGGTNDEEFRAIAVVDRVNTVWTTWQATTFGCVQCHAHPYDPIPHEDYYRFMAFLDNSEDADLDNDFPRLPVAVDQAPEARDALARNWQELQKLRTFLNNRGAAVAKTDRTWQPLIPSAATSSAASGNLTITADGRITAGGTLPVGVEYTLTATPPAAPLTALKLEIFPDNDDPLSWPERASVLSRIIVYRKNAEGMELEVPLQEVVADYLAGPFDPMESLKDGAAGFGSYPSQSGGRWCVIVLEKPVTLADGEVLLIRLRQGAVSNANQQACTLRNFRISASTSADWQQHLQSPDHRANRERWQALRQLLNSAPATNVPVLMERTPAATRTTRVWERGNRLTPKAAVEPGLPERLNPPKTEGRMSRLELARWLTGKENPLTARVIANRLWAGMFGQGLVVTLEDFGSSGALPSHPALLDHLALRLRETHQWSIKKFLKELALSATYAQTAHSPAEAVTRDPGNALLARGPRQRLSAEMVRDQALKLSGLLENKIGGPPVFPPQPDGVWNSVYNGETWKTSEGPDRYRRAIYTYVKRTSGYPGLLAFDAPARDLCSARRLTTNTPLQALVTLNDPAFLEMAAAMAARTQQAGGSVRDQISRACQEITLAAPPAGMVDALTDLYHDALADYKTESAEEPSPALLAMTLVANTLLNTDLALNR